MIATSAAQVTVSGSGASSPNGISALEGSAVSPTSSSYDTMWADSTDGRWKLNNHNLGPQDLGVWACRAAAGTVEYSSTTPVSGVYPEACVPVGTAGQILMLSGSTPAPGWSSSYVSSVAGTLNQINVSGTGSPTLSITNPFIFPGKATFAASTTSNESFNIPSGTPPTSPVAGAVFFDGAEFYFNDGSASQPHPRIVRLAADSSASTSTSMASLSGMLFSLLANTNYTVSCDVFYLVSATSGGLALTFTGPTSPTNVIFGGYKGYGSNNASETPLPLPLRPRSSPRPRTLPLQRSSPLTSRERSKMGLIQERCSFNTLTLPPQPVP